MEKAVQSQSQVISPKYQIQITSPEEFKNQLPSKQKKHKLMYNHLKKQQINVKKSYQGDLLDQRRNDKRKQSLEKNEKELTVTANKDFKKAYSRDSSIDLNRSYNSPIAHTFSPLQEPVQDIKVTSVTRLQNKQGLVPGKTYLKHAIQTKQEEAEKTRTLMKKQSSPQLLFKQRNLTPVSAGLSNSLNQEITEMKEKNMIKLLQRVQQDLSTKQQDNNQVQTQEQRRKSLVPSEKKVQKFKEKIYRKQQGAPQERKSLKPLTPKQGNQRNQEGRNQKKVQFRPFKERSPKEIVVIKKLEQKLNNQC